MLPSEFLRMITAELGADEASALCEALESTEPVTAVRLNPFKPGGAAIAAGGEAIPWSALGFRLPQRPEFTTDPSFHAGSYYVQEPASQFVGHLLSNLRLDGARILDMCAAPGGKTTLYASIAGRDGLVVANEPDRRRANILADNVRKWGAGNTVVTCNEPSRVATFAQWFDVVAVDAPCSGEGMFRKDEGARRDWSEGNVRMCAARQLDILREAWRALRPGGTLIYRTCTFNRTENEGTLERFLEFAGAEVVGPEAVECPESWGIITGSAGPFATYRFLPHRTRSEGFFAAVARKSTSAPAPDLVPMPRSRKSILTAADRTAAAELSRWVQEPSMMRFFAVGDSFYGYRTAQAEAVRLLSESLAVICSGVEMGRIYKGVLKPEHSLAMYAWLNRSAVPSAELQGEDMLEYLRCGTVRHEPFAEGVNLVTGGGLAVGFAKRIGRRVNVMYPNSLRIMNK